MLKKPILLCAVSILFSCLFLAVCAREAKTAPLPPVSDGVVLTQVVTDETRIDLNTADTKQLQALPGIGPVKAEAILTYREQNGFFLTAEEIKNVSGIGEKIYLNIADRITVGEIQN